MDPDGVFAQCESFLRPGSSFAIFCQYVQVCSICGVLISAVLKKIDIFTLWLVLCGSFYVVGFTSTRNCMCPALGQTVPKIAGIAVVLSHAVGGFVDAQVPGSPFCVLSRIEELLVFRL